MEYLLILATPLLLTAAGLAIVRFRRLSWVEDIGFRSPAASAVLLWLLAFLVVAGLQEWLSTGPGAAGSWQGRYGPADLAIRILAVALVYPLAEEFFFRGVLLGVVRRRFGAVAAVVASALVFGLIHVQYDWPVWVVIDGLLFGAARVGSGSIYVPMLLHCLGNAYAVWERLH